jgi:hypothetical protein
LKHWSVQIWATWRLQLSQADGGNLAHVEAHTAAGSLHEAHFMLQQEERSGVGCPNTAAASSPTSTTETAAAAAILRAGAAID